MPEDSPRASAFRLRILAERGILTPEQSADLEHLLRSRLPWLVWVDRLLLFLGSALLLAGIIFFFAYNWRDLSPLQKFAVVEGSLALCAFGAWWRGVDTTPGRVLLTATCVLVGVFLAVFGQIYQTGADTYELFTGWALLILPWTLFARFGPLWLLWLVLLNVGLVLSWDVGWTWTGAGEAELCMLVGLLNGAALTAREGALAGGLRWLGTGWLRSLPCLATFAALTTGIILAIFDQSAGRSSHLLPVSAFLGAVVIGTFVYRYVLPSLSSLAIIMLGVCLALISFIGRAAFDNRDSTGTFLLMAVVVVVTFASAAWWLRRIAPQIRALTR